MSLATGSLLGPYELLAQIGAGGMGQVYRARDTRLGRIVAVKILPPHRFAVGDFAERFRREARAISSLSHPNVCALYDVGETKSGDETVSYLVMEFLEGETLRERLRSKLTPKQSIDLAVQIASGLAAAHRKGLVHRDLKPENIFLTREGIVKIVDFGLVKASTSDSATTLNQTEPGLVMGTANYMSPEQVRGDSLDHRSDVFSFGVVLYEMLSGEQPFEGGSPVETMARILHEEPQPLAEYVTDLPPGVAEIVERCLAKEPEDRFNSARDLSFALDAISRGSRPSIATRRPTAPPKRGTRKAMSSKARIALGILLLAALAGTIAAGRFLGRDSDVAPAPATRPLTHSGQDGSPAASPDGRVLAFVSSRDGTRRIWLKQLSDGTEVALTAGPDDWAPRFSRDGSSVLFTRTSAAGSSLWRVAAVGGEPRKVIDNAFDGDFAPNGRQVVFVRNRVDGQRLSVLCVGTPGQAEVIELASTANEEMIFPRWSPDGEWIAVTRKPRSSTAGSLLLMKPDGSKQQVVSRPEAHGLISSSAWTPDSRALVFAELETFTAVIVRTRGGTARILRYDLASGTFRQVLWNPHAAADALDVLPGGRLVFAEDFTRQNLREVSLDGSGDGRWLTRGTAIDRQPSWAPDGKRIVFCSDRSGNHDVWELVLDTGSVRRLTDDPGVDWDPSITPDGELLWSSNRGGHFEVWSGSGDGGSARRVTNDGVDAENPSVPRDGATVFYDSSHPQKEGLWRVGRDGRDARLVLRGETAHPEVSADGQYVLYHRPEQSRFPVIEVVRVSDGATFEVARDFSGEADAGRGRWLGATNTVVFRGKDEQGRTGLFVQPFIPGVDTSAQRRPLTGFDRDTVLETFAISPDGKRAILSLLEPSSGLMIADGVALGE